MYAAVSGAVDVANLLLENKANPYITDREGRNVFHIASQGNCIAIITQLLVHTNGYNIDARDNKGRTCLHIAAEQNLTVLAKMLIKEGQCNVNILDSDSRNPLMIFKQNKNVEMVESLYIN